MRNIDPSDFGDGSTPGELPVTPVPEVKHRKKKIALLLAVLVIGCIVIVRCSLPL